MVQVVKYVQTINQGVGHVNWSNLTNLRNGSTSSYAECKNIPGERKAKQIIATNFGFNIPSDARIDSIKVEWADQKNKESINGTFNMLDSEFNLIGVNSAKQQLKYPLKNTITSRIFQWTRSNSWTPTPAQINSSNFGFNVSYGMNTDIFNVLNLKCFYIRIIVNYTNPTYSISVAGHNAIVPETVTTTITLKNTNNINGNIQRNVTITPPIGLSYKSQSGQGSFNNTNKIWTVQLSNGTAVIKIVWNVSTSGSKSITANVKNNAGSSWSNTGSFKITDPVFSINSNLPPLGVQNDIIDYTILLDVNTSALSGTNLSVTLPSGFVYQSHTSNGNYNQTIGLWDAIFSNKRAILNIKIRLTGLGNITHTLTKSGVILTKTINIIPNVSVPYYIDINLDNTLLNQLEENTSYTITTYGKIVNDKNYPVYQGKENLHFKLPYTSPNLLLYTPPFISEGDISNITNFDGATISKSTENTLTNKEHSILMTPGSINFITDIYIEECTQKIHIHSPTNQNITITQYEIELDDSIRQTTYSESLNIGDNILTYNFNPDYPIQIKTEINSLEELYLQDVTASGTGAVVSNKITGMNWELLKGIMIIDNPSDVILGDLRFYAGYEEYYPEDIFVDYNPLLCIVPTEYFNEYISPQILTENRYDILPESLTPATFTIPSNKETCEYLLKDFDLGGLDTDKQILGVGFEIKGEYLATLPVTIVGRMYNLNTKKLYGTRSLYLDQEKGLFQLGGIEDRWNVPVDLDDINQLGLSLQIKNTNNELLNIDLSDVQIVLYYIFDETGGTDGLLVDGEHSKYYQILIDKVELPAGTENELTNLDVAGADGTYPIRLDVKEKEIKLQCLLLGECEADNYRILDRLVRLFSNKRDKHKQPIKKSLIFDDDPEKQYFFVRDKAINVEQSVQDKECKIELVVPEGTSEALNPITSGGNGRNEGNVRVFPLIQLITDGSDHLRLYESIDDQIFIVNYQFPIGTVLLMDSKTKTIEDINGINYTQYVDINSVRIVLNNDYDFSNTTGGTVQKVIYTARY